MTMRMTKVTDWAAAVIFAGVKVIAVFEFHAMLQCASTVASGFKSRLLSSTRKAAALRMWSVLPAHLYWIATCGSPPVVCHILLTEARVSQYCDM